MTTAATDYETWFNAEPDSYETERDADAAYMRALEEVYRETLIHVGRCEENDRRLVEVIEAHRQKHESVLNF